MIMCVCVLMGIIWDKIDGDDSHSHEMQSVTILLERFKNWRKFAKRSLHTHTVLLIYSPVLYYTIVVMWGEK